MLRGIVTKAAIVEMNGWRHVQRRGRVVWVRGGGWGEVFRWSAAVILKSRRERSTTRT